MSQERLSVQGRDEIVKKLLQAQLVTLYHLSSDIGNKVKKDCEQRHVRYKGRTSWPMGLLAWHNKQRRALIEFARGHSLCWRHIKEAARGFKMKRSVV
jgi:hypothetical protein